MARISKKIHHRGDGADGVRDRVQWQIEVRRPCQTQSSKFARCHADDRRRLTLDGDDPSDGAGVPVEDTAPIAFRENGHERRAASIVLHREAAADWNADTEHVEEVVAREIDTGPLWNAADRHERA